jgi:hypothetical protein
MRDDSRGIGGTVGPPWSVDVLADLQAGVLDERQAAELWPLAQTDPEARAILEALEATTADLGGLALEPAEPMPAEVAARLDAALAEEARRAFGEAASRPQAPPQPQAPPPGMAPVTDLAAARRRHHRRLGWGAGVLAVAAAAVAAIAIAVPSQQQTGGNAVAQPPAPTSAGSGPLALSSGGMQAAVGQSLGVRDYGPLGNQERLDACLAANGFDPVTKPAGFREVTIDGRPAVLVILTTGQLAQFRLVAFPPDCGPGHQGVLFDKVVGR